MQDTNKNAIWIFAVIIVVLGIIWATSGKPKASSSLETASTTPMVSDEGGEVMDNEGAAAMDKATAVTSSTNAKSPTLPAAGIGPQD